MVVSKNNQTTEKKQCNLFFGGKIACGLPGEHVRYNAACEKWQKQKRG